MDNDCCINTEIEIWRKVEGDCFSPSISVAENKNIVINVNDYVMSLPVESWFEAGIKIFSVNPNLKNWRRKLAFWLLNWT